MSEQVCPVWIGYLLASPIRKLFQNPEAILKPYISEGTKAIDIGSAMGFFSIPMAKLAGKTGRVVCVDIQQKMLDRLETRARKARIFDRLILIRSLPGTLNLDNINEEMDFALAFAVLHEIPDLSIVFKDISKVLKKGGTFLIAEPSGHVSMDKFNAELSIAKDNGFRIISNPLIAKSFTALLEKN